MGKKRMAVLGGAEEEELKTKTAVKREQKKLREGLPLDPPTNPRLKALQTSQLALSSLYNPYFIE